MFAVFPLFPYLKLKELHSFRLLNGANKYFNAPTTDYCEETTLCCLLMGCESGAAHLIKNTYTDMIRPSPLIFEDLLSL